MLINIDPLLVISGELITRNYQNVRGAFTDLINFIIDINSCITLRVWSTDNRAKCNTRNINSDVLNVSQSPHTASPGEIDKQFSAKCQCLQRVSTAENSICLHVYQACIQVYGILSSITHNPV